MFAQNEDFQKSTLARLSNSALMDDNVVIEKIRLMENTTIAIAPMFIVSSPPCQQNNYAGNRVIIKRIAPL